MLIFLVIYSLSFVYLFVFLRHAYFMFYIIVHLISKGSIFIDCFFLSLVTKEKNNKEINGHMLMINL